MVELGAVKRSLLRLQILHVLVYEMIRFNLFQFLCRRYKSEYELNFKPPQDFEYLEGAWRGANPPHIEAKEVRML